MPNSQCCQSPPFPLCVCATQVPNSLYEKVGLGVYNLGCGDLVVNDRALADILTACPHFKYV